MDRAVKDKALETLDNMERLVQREALAPRLGAYVIPTEGDSEGTVLAACNGHKMCLVGSAWIAHGDATICKVSDTEDWALLYGVDGDDDRAEYLAQRPALKVVYEALGVEALEMYAERPDTLSLDDDYPYFAEALFEGGDMTHDDLLELIARCRRRIAPDLVEA